MNGRISLTFLGQSGIRFELGTTVLYVDPYLTDHVAHAFGDDLRRMTPAHLQPDHVTDADWVLLTHDHLDHFDPWTLEPLAAASPSAKFVCPDRLIQPLQDLGVAEERIIVAHGRWIDLCRDLRLHPVPAAHPVIEHDSNGGWLCVGYVIEYSGRRLYHAGDTSADSGVFAAVAELGPIDVAFLPVNERNFFKEQAGILGNMSVREAFLSMIEIGAQTLIPVHWDLIRSNSVFPEELELLYELMAPPFQMCLKPTEI